MFDFEKLDVYQRAKQLNKEVLKFLRDNKAIDSFLRDQLKRASISVVLNIAEGSGKFSKAEKKHFYTIARGSVYECVSVFDILFEEQLAPGDIRQNFYEQFEIISKMLLRLIQSQEI